MDNFWIIIVIALAVFALFIVYDKRKSIVAFFKSKFKKSKKEVAPKEPPQKPKEDPDTQVLQENLQIGGDEVPQVKPLDIADLPVFSDDEFQPVQINDEFDADIDLDKLFEELKQADLDNSNKYKSSKLGETDFDDISLDDMDEFLESINYDRLSNKTQKSLHNYGYGNQLTGKELGEAIKNLPPQIKAIIISDILKPKF